MANPEGGGKHTIYFAPTVAHWHDQDDAVRILGHKHPNAACQLALHVCLDTSKALASIKLRVPVGFKELPRKTNAFIITYPERIECLEVLQPDGHNTTEGLPTTVRSILVQQQRCSGDGDIVRLRVRLTQPSALLLPSLRSFAPSSVSSAGALELAQSLAASTLFDLHLPATDASTKTLHALSASAASGLKLMVSDLNLSRLYNGHGARLFDAGRLDGLVRPPDSPPSYDELGPTPPPAGSHDDAPPLKRARKESTSDEPARAREHSEAVPRSKDEMIQTREYLLREVRKEIEKQVARMEERIQARIEAASNENNAKILRRFAQLSQQVSRLEEDAKDRNDRSREEEAERYERLREEVAKNRDAKENLTEQLENLRDEANERFDKLETDTWDLVEDAKDEVSNLIDARIDDQVLDMKCEMQDHITEELGYVEDRIKNDLRTAVLSIDFE